MFNQILVYNDRPVYVLKKYNQIIIPISFSIDINPNNIEKESRIMVETNGFGTIPLEDLRYINISDKDWFEKDYPELYKECVVKSINRLSVIINPSKF